MKGKGGQLGQLGTVRFCHYLRQRPSSVSAGAYPPLAGRDDLIAQRGFGEK